jgi:cytochrome P450 family 3 subfamily A
VFDWRTKGLRGLFPVPVLGTSWMYVFKYPFEVDLMCTKRFGPVFVEQLPISGISVNVADVKLIRQVMVKSFASFPKKLTVPWLPPYVRYSLFAISGPQWRRIRSIVTPIFTSGRLRQIGVGLKDPVQRNLNTVERRLGQGQTAKMDVKQLCNFVNIDIIANVVFSMHLQSETSRDQPFFQRVLDMNRFSLRQVLTMLLVPRSLYSVFHITAFKTDSMNYFAKMTENLMNERRQNPQVKYNDFLQLLMDAECSDYADVNGNFDDASNKKRLNSEEIVGQCLFFFIAGVDSVATAISASLYKLAENPRVQQKLFSELESKLPDDNFVPEDLAKCEYLERVVLEVMRVIPPVTKLFRRATETIELENGLVIQKDDMVTIPVYAVHHNPDYYDSPQEFRPERFEFIDPEIKQYAYLSFSTGPMNCVGMRFAMLEMKYFLASFLKRFEVRLCADGSSRLDFFNVPFLLMFNELQLDVFKRN